MTTLDRRAVRVPLAIQCELDHFRDMEDMRAEAMRAVIRPRVFGSSLTLVPSSHVPPKSDDADVDYCMGLDH